MVKFKYLKKVKKQLKSIFKNQKEKLISIVELLINIACYGFVLNLVTLAFFGFDFSFLNLIAIGFAWYFLSSEIPIIIDKYRGRH